MIEYSQELADRMCEQLAEGHSLRTVCKQEGMPSKAAVFRWLRIYPEFLANYTRAKQESADALVEEILDIADDGTNDWMEVHGKDGKTGYAFNSEHFQRSRLRVDTRKWIAAKQKPKKYGDKLDVDANVNGKMELSGTVTFVTPEAKE